MSNYLRPGLKYGLLLVIFSLLAVQPCAKAAQADKDAKIYKDFLEATGARQHYQQMKSMMIRQSQQDFIAGLENTLPLKKDITKDQQKQVMPLIKQAFDNYISGLQSELDRIMPYKTVVAEVYRPAFAKHFSTAELKQITDFYTSATGKKFIANLPTLMQNSFNVVNKQYAPQLQTVSKKLAASELAKLKKKVDQKLSVKGVKPKNK